MTLLQLQYFQALARVLHYTHTAEELHISQPSLSYAISELEKELGVKLFYKEKRQVETTVYGQQFLPYVEKALSLLEEGRSVLEQMSGRSDQIVRLGYFHSISASLIPAIVEQFYQVEDNQKIRFSFTEAPSYDIFTKIKNGELDMGFCLHQADWAKSARIMRQPLYLAVPSGHHLSGRRSVSFEDFAREPQIMLDRSSNLRSLVDQAFKQHSIIPNVVFEVRECNAALQYVGLKFGIAILPQVPAMDSEKVEVLPIYDADREFVRNVYLTWPDARPISPVAQTARDYIVEHFALPD
ncbi:MAG: LysR family transcriptional regulator [Lawsonibacter sp.]|nr:LysR family transcriptional regulator [Lawsonibacter sp.]MCI9155378.1 LysR family transcriptional regulator [Lawsonibacter sp.]